MDPADLVARLAARESEVLGHMAAGLSNDAIAGQLHISRKTVEAMARSIFRKLELVEDPSVNRRVVACSLYRDAEVGRTSVPAYAGSFIGRQAVMDRLAEMVASSRVVTVAGPGGVGKSRVVAEWAATAGGSVRWADLASTRSVDATWAAVFEAFGIAAPSRTIGQRRLSGLLGRHERWLVLDNEIGRAHV